MEPITWEEAQREVAALGLPEALRALFEDPHSVPDVLTQAMRSATEVFEYPACFPGYPPGAITPLWTNRTGHLVVGHRRSGGAPGFLRFLLEEQSLVEEGLTFAQLVVWELVDVWDESHDPEGDLREAAAYLEFPATDRLVHALSTTTRETREEHEVFLAAVRALLETEKPS